MSILYDCLYTCTNVQEKLTEIGGFLMLRQENNLIDNHLLTYAKKKIQNLFRGEKREIVGGK